jgi:adenine phosphoribosyltransferase
MQNPDLFSFIRQIKDFPKPGINFYDITPLLTDPVGFQKTINRIAYEYLDSPNKPEVIVGIDARGFIIAGALASKLGCGVVLVRKLGKLPHSTISEKYTLEYGEATLEVHTDSFTKYKKVLVVDDLLATGGTAAATVKLVEKAGGEVVGLNFIIELSFLNGRRQLEGYHVSSLMCMDN